jgi:phage baseplate assembly protein W
VSALARHDYGFPLRIDGGSQQTAQARYADHVVQMIEQILLTTPGERWGNPEFGCGLRTIVFAPMSQALQVSAGIQVRQALGQWLSGVIAVQDVEVTASGDGSALEPGTVQVTVSYTLIDTQTPSQTTVTLL